MTIVLNHKDGHYYADWKDIDSELILKHLIGRDNFYGEHYLEDVRLLAAAHGWCVAALVVLNEMIKEYLMEN